MRTIETVIHRLGYHSSEKLFYLSKIDKCTDLSWHDRRVLKELAPYAVYVVDGRVLTVFFDDLDSRTDVGRILRTFKIKKNVEVTDNGKDNF